MCCLNELIDKMQIIYNIVYNIESFGTNGTLSSTMVSGFAALSLSYQTIIPSWHDSKLMHM